MSGFCLCLDCGGVFEKDYLNNQGVFQFERPCPVAGCDGQLIELDEEMIEPIWILNNKGYLTKYCCSGHMHQQPEIKYIYGYIMFYEDTIELMKEQKIDCPEGWYYDGNCIRYKITREESLMDTKIKMNRKIESLLI